MKARARRRAVGIFSLARREAKRAGESFRVRYSEAPLIADLIPRYQAEVRAQFAALSPDQRLTVLTRVREALAKYASLVAAALAGADRGPTSQEARDAVDDIAIWYANEELEGRAADHVVPAEPLHAVPVAKKPCS